MKSRSAAFLFLVALIGCNRDKPAASPAGSAAGSFSVVNPAKKSLPKSIEQPGTIQAYESAPLFAKFPGFVKIVHLDIGDPVEGPTKDKPGTVIAEIAMPELEDEGREKDALVEQAKAEVEQSKKQVVIAEANVDTANAHVLEAKAGVKRALATLKRWESEASRVAEMVRNKSLDPQTGDETQNQLRSVEAAADEARARMTVAEKSVVKAQAELEKAREDVKAVDAKRRVADAEAARLRSLLEYRFIRAPFAGTVTRRNVDTGHFVQPAGTVKGEPLFIVASLDKVRVPIDVPETDAALVRKGAKAMIRVPALKAEFEGEVKRTSESLENGSRTLRVEIDLPNTDGRLRPGLFVNAKLTVGMPEVWSLPANAVVKQADQTVVFLHVEGKAVRLPIQPGRSDGKFTEVFKKLKPGTTSVWEDWTGTEDVLSGPANTLADGQPVQPVR